MFSVCFHRLCWRDSVASWVTYPPTSGVPSTHFHSSSVFSSDTPIQKAFQWPLGRRFHTKVWKGNNKKTKQKEIFWWIPGTKILNLTLNCRVTKPKFWLAARQTRCRWRRVFMWWLRLGSVDYIWIKNLHTCASKPVTSSVSAGLRTHPAAVQ